MTMVLDLPHNLTGPLSMEDFDRGDGTQGGLSFSDDTGIPGISAGILVPHIVCTMLVVLRVCSRRICLRKWFLDDTLIIVAWFWSTAVCVVYMMAVQVPRFRDANITPFSPITPYLTRTYLGLIFYQLSLCFTKLSIGFFYLRMFNSRPAMRTVSWLTIALTFIFSVPLTFMSIFQCYPDKGQVLGHDMACISFTELLVFSSCAHTASDAWIMVMMIPTIQRLELPLRQKAALSVFLSLGIFVIAASMIRLQLSLHKDFRPTMGMQGSNTMAFFVVTVLECDMAIVCATAPMIRPILAKMKPHILSPRYQPLPRPMGGSFNLTTVVSYHGYPWTEQMERHRAGSLANMRVGGVKIPAPVLLTTSHRTPSSLSLKTMLPSRRGGMTGPDTQPILSKSEVGS